MGPGVSQQTGDSWIMDGPMGHANTAVDCIMDGPTASDQTGGSVEKYCNTPLHQKVTNSFFRLGLEASFKLSFVSVKC